MGIKDNEPLLLTSNKTAAATITNAEISVTIKPFTLERIFKKLIPLPKETVVNRLETILTPPVRTSDTATTTNVNAAMIAQTKVIIERGRFC